MMDENCFVIHHLPDGRWVWIFRMVYTYRLAVSGAGNWETVDDAWCYETREQACMAALAWDGTGEPAGWIKHPGSGRWRPNGDASREFNTNTQTGPWPGREP